MKNKFLLGFTLLALFSTLFISITTAQCLTEPFVLQPGPNDGKDAVVMSEISRQSTNVGDHQRWQVMTWTWSGSPGSIRQYFDFDIPALPENAYITSAILDLYAAPWVHQLCLSGSNESLLEAVSAPWDEHTINWLNQPGGTGTPEYLPAHCTNNSNLSLDVTNLVEAFSPNGDGLVWSLQNEAYYRALYFYSSDSEDPAKRPRLTINWDYSIPPVDTDGDGLGDICDPILDVCGAINLLIEQIESLDLPNNLENNLIDKVEKASTFFSNGQEYAAQGKLGAFIGQVNAKRGNPLTDAEADALIAIAQIIIDAIDDETANCDNPGARLSGSSQEDILQLDIAPNPFDQSTMINFTLKEDKKVSLIIYDMNGKQVKVLVDGLMSNGDYQIEWNARNESGQLVPGGVYYSRIQAGNHLETRSIVRVH